MAYSYTRNTKRPSKSLEKPVPTTGKPRRILEEAQYPVEILEVFPAGDFFDLTFHNRQREQHKERIWLSTLDRSGPSYPYRQLLASLFDDPLSFIGLVEKDKRWLKALVGLRLFATLERKAGVLVRVDSRGHYNIIKYAPSQEDHESLMTKETFRSRTAALAWAEERKIPYAYMSVRQWSPWAEQEEHNRSLVITRTKRKEASDEDGD